MFSKINKYLLFTNLFLLQVYLIRFQIGPFPTNLQEILIGIQLLVFLLWKFSHRAESPDLKSLKKYWIITSMVALTTLSVLMVDIPQYFDYLRNLKFLVFGIILALIFLETFKKNDERFNALKIAGYGAFTFAIFSVLYNLLGFNLTPDLRINGPLDSAVALAFYLVPFFLYFFIRFFENRTETSNILFAVIIGLVILGTRSMGTIAGTFIILLFYIFKSSNIFKKRSGKIILISITLIILGAITYTKIIPTFQTPYSSLDERGQIWEVSKALLKEPMNGIFGVGLGQFNYHFFHNAEKVLIGAPLDYYPLHPHNIFLLFIMNYGILGLIFIIYCTYLIVKKLIKMPELKHNVTNFSILILAYFFLHGLIDSPFFKNDMMILFLIFMEMGIGKTSTKLP